MAATKTLGFQIVIPRRATHCCLGEEAFEGGMSYHSVVSFDDEEPVRHDYCDGCWEKVKDQYQAEQAQHWKGKIPKKYVSPYSGLNQEERALAILKDLLPAETQEQKEELFVWALFLAHKRRLVMRAEDEESLHYEDTQSGDMIAIPRVDPTALRVEEIQATIADKMTDKPPPKQEEQAQ